jgi:two-component system, OmpR family, KDP operon response regulator KdpE
MKALIVEDAGEVVETLSLLLGIRWPDCTVISTNTGYQAALLVETEAPDLVILDLGLPDVDGLEIVQEIREFSDVPIIVVTAHEGEISRVKCLERGADDYLNKPFSHTELLARVKAVLRRTSMPELRRDQGILRFPDLTIDFVGRRICHSGGGQVQLTPIEWNLLSYLCRNRGRVIPYELLSEKVWGSQYVTRTAMKAAIHRLRQKLADNDRPNGLIRSHPGVGYSLIIPGSDNS